MVHFILPIDERRYGGNSGRNKQGAHKNTVSFTGYKKAQWNRHVQRHPFGQTLQHFIQIAVDGVKHLDAVTLPYNAGLRFAQLPEKPSPQCSQSSLHRCTAARW
jgi:hypothetical protein